MKTELVIAATGITGLSPAQLLAGAEPPKHKKITLAPVKFELDDEELIRGQIAGEEREILRFINPSPPPTLDFSHLDQLREQAIAQVGIPRGYLK